MAELKSRPHNFKDGLGQYITSGLYIAFISSQYYGAPTMQVGLRAPELTVMVSDDRLPWETKKALATLLSL